MGGLSRSIGTVASFFGISPVACPWPGRDHENAADFGHGFPLKGSGPSIELPFLEGEHETVSLERPRWIGRSRECDRHLVSPAASRRHALVLPLTDGTLWAIDLKTSAGTRVNGRALDVSRIRDGDRIEVAGEGFTCHVPIDRNLAAWVSRARTCRLDQWIRSTTDLVNDTSTFLNELRVFTKNSTESIGVISPQGLGSLRESLGLARLGFMVHRNGASREVEDLDPEL